MSENIQKNPLPCGGGLGMGETQSIKQGYKQTSLGILPQEWEVVRLGDICEFLKGKGISKDDLADNGIPCIRYGELYTIYDEIIQKVVSRTNLDSGELIFSKANDIVLPTSGETAIDICKASCVMIDNVALGGDLNVLRSKQNGAFLSYYINHMAKYDIAKLAQGVSIVHLYASELKSLQIPLPPLAEQEKIAQILSVWDKGISVLKSLIEAKTKRKKALMQRLLTPPTHPLTPPAREGEQKSHHDTKAPPLAGGVGVGYSHIENNRNDDKVLDCHDLTASNLAMTEKNSKAKQSLRFAEFTDKWQEMRLGDICEITTGSLNANAMVESGKFAFFTCAREVYAIDNYAFDTEALLVSGNGANVGYIHYYKGKFNAYQRTYVLDKFSCDILFVKFFLDKYLKKRIAQEKNEGNTPYIVLSTLQDMKIVLPNSLAEQKKIAQVLSACDKEIELLKSKFQCLKTQKKGLMQRLLNGEVRVKC